MKYGFIKVAAAVPAVRVADVEYNVQEIEKLIALADGEGVELLCFPELSLTGYTCQDLFKEKLLLDKAEEGLLQLLDFTRQLDIVCVVGLPVQAGGLLLNCAAVIQSGTPCWALCRRPICLTTTSSTRNAGLPRRRT